MNSLEQQLLQQEVGDAEPRLQVCTGTKVDAGKWWRKVPVWLCVMADELVLVAVGRRRLFERIPFADCPDAAYNHASGELVIAPPEGRQLNRVKLPPSEALKILELLNSQN